MLASRIPGYGHNRPPRKLLGSMPDPSAGPGADAVPPSRLLMKRGSDGVMRSASRPIVSPSSISCSFWTRSARSTPVATACSCAGLVMTEKSPTFGLFKFGSFGKLHALTASAASARAMYLIRIAPPPCRRMLVRGLVEARISEIHREREEIAAGRRIRREILAAIDVLVTEVRDLGVEALVGRPRDQ